MKKMVSIFICILLLIQLFCPIISNADTNEEYFLINALETNPGQLITLKYHFRIEPDKHYFLHFKNLEDGYSYKYKDLDVDKNGNYITGELTFKASKTTGQYELQVYGPKPKDPKIIDKIVLKLGTAIETAVEATDPVTNEAINIAFGVIEKISDRLMSIMNALGIHEKEGNPIVLLIKSPPITIKNYETKITCKNSAKVGEKIVVNYENASPNAGSWIGIYPQNGADQEWIKMHLLKGKTSGSVEFNIPYDVGVYNIRTFYDGFYYKTGISGDVFVEKHNINFYDIPDELKPYDALTIRYDGAPSSASGMLWIGIFPINEDSYEGDVWSKNLLGHTSANIYTATPKNPGVYCFRIYSGTNELLATSKSFEVTQKLNIPENQSSNSEIHYIHDYTPKEESSENVTPTTESIPQETVTQESTPQETLPWTGIWETDYADGTLLLTQTGNTVKGTFGIDDNKIEGTVVGNKLIGKFTDSEQKGDFEFVMFEDKKSFSGKYKFEYEDYYSSWGGKKRSPVAKPSASSTSASKETSNWEGVWHSDYGTIIFTQNGTAVRGTYGIDEEIIEGTVLGDRLKGTAKKVDDIGEFEFIMSSDGKSFNGQWTHEYDSQFWNGQKKK